MGAWWILRDANRQANLGFINEPLQNYRVKIAQTPFTFHKATSWSVMTGLQEIFFTHCV